MSAGIEFNANVLNQLGTPAMNSNLFANRPAAGFTGRIFISTDTREIYRDTGTTWELIGSGGGSVNIYNSDGTLTGHRTVNLSSNNLLFQGTGQFRISSTAGDAFKNFSSSAALSKSPTNGVGYAIVYNAAESGYVGFQQRDGTSSRWGFQGLSEVLSANTIGLGIVYSGNLSFGSSTVEYMRLLSNGRLLMNTGTDSGFLADFNGTLRAQSLFSNFVQVNPGTGGGFNEGVAFYLTSAPTIKQSISTTAGGTNTQNQMRLNLFDGGGTISLLSMRGDGIVHIEQSNIPTYQNTAILNLVSTTRGFLSPRMTTTQRNAITSPATGLEIFNITTNRPNFYDGTAWRELTNIYLNDGTMISNRVADVGGFLFNIQNTKTAALANVSNYTQQTILTENLPAGTSCFGAAYYTAGLNRRVLNLAGNADFGNATISAGSASNSSINFSAVGTLTANQAGLRTFAGHQIFSQFGGNASGTITHYAGLQILGLYNDNSGTITPTITNAYGLVINNLNDYTHTFTLTNRWGLYQTGASDNNYLAGKLLVGTTTVTGRQVHISGNIELTTTLAGTAGGASGNHLSIWVNGNEYKIALLNP